MARRDRDPRAWVKLDVGYFDNPKIISLLDDSPRAVLLHLRMVAYCGQHLTDGDVTVGHKRCARDVAADQADVDRLIAAGLLERDEAGRLVVHDYLQHNTSREAAMALSEVRAEAGRRGGNASKAQSNEPSNEPSNLLSNEPSNLLSNLPSRREEKRREQKPSSASADGVPDGFAEFWLACPRKVGKGQAVRAYKSALKKTDAATLLSSMQAFAHSVDGKDPQYIAHPATWLNGERWADEETPDPQPSRDWRIDGWA